MLALEGSGVIMKAWELRSPSATFRRGQPARSQRTHDSKLLSQARRAQLVGLLGDRPFEGVDVWVPRIDEPSFLDRRSIELGAGYLDVIARLPPGGSPAAAARTDAERVGRAYAEQFPDHIDARSQIAIDPLAERLVGPLRALFLMLLGAVGCVLLIACADIANLLLAQGLARQREVALRAALGARHGRVLLGVVLEGLLLSLAGGALEVVTAALGLRLLVAANPAALAAIPRVARRAVRGGARPGAGVGA